MTPMAEDDSVAERLRRELEEEIDSGRLQAGEKLESERVLAETRGVSRGTLRRALAALEEAGLVRRVQGRGGGTFVTRRMVERDTTGIEGVPRYLAKQGYQAETTILGTKLTPAQGRVTEALKLRENSWVYAIRRLRLADGSPFSLDQAYFPADVFPGLLDQPLGGSLYRLLETQYGVTAHNAEERIEVVRATAEESQLLSVATGDPLLLVRRTTFDGNDRPIEFSSDLFRADRTRIHTRTPGLGIRASGVHVELLADKG